MTTLSFKDFLKKADEKEQLNLVKETLEDVLDIRFCDICGKAFASGYYDGDNWGRHYCSDECLHTCYTPEEWAEAYGDGETDCYYSDWEGDADIINTYNEYLAEKNKEN